MVRPKAAGIQPTKKVQKVIRKEWDRLIFDTRRVLSQAIECGGSTISDFLNTSQERGYFQINFKVYGKEGQDYTNCTSKIKKKKSAAGRVTIVQTARNEGTFLLGQVTYSYFK